MEDVPTGDYFSPAMHVNAMRTARPLPRAMSLADYKQWQEPIDVALKRMAKDDPRIRVLDPGELICPDECMFEAKGKPLYFDGHHLSPSGVALIRPLLGEVFEDFKSSDAASD